MTIDTIFTRYEVPNDVRERALLRGAYVLALQREWVGPDVSWPLLVKVLLFADLGEQSALIRKKVGLDKYAVTLISRGVPKHAPTIATGHDWHQHLYLYAALQTGVVTQTEEAWDACDSVRTAIEHNLLHPVPVPATCSEHERKMLGSINILHYKNPSI